MTKKPSLSNPFNTSFETGLRSVCILEANLDLALDLQHMLAFDHLIVHTGDMPEGPDSLHIENQSRNGELLIRRPIVEKGLLLMESKGLITKIFSETGIVYSATEFAPVFLNSLTSVYVSGLRSRAAWAIEKYSRTTGDFFVEVFNVAFNRWTTEFQLSEMSLEAN